MRYSSIFLLVCSATTFFYLLGLIFFLTDHEPKDYCEMTYMFEYPQYVKVSQEIDQKYPKYGLYAYGEGRMTSKARNMNFNGIPVLFIPGNAGSYQQVRSLSSVALRKALNSMTPYHFDYFTVDLNSEYSALYGPVLYDQLDYVKHSIIRVLGLYKSKNNQPKQVVLVGHSMGGIVAKKVIATLPKENSELVSILIVLASPLTRAPLIFDRYLSKFYDIPLNSKSNTTIISVGGGYSDFLVPTYLTTQPGNNSIGLVATNIPRSWVESTHVQILWCKQTVLALNRALFDSVDKTRQISNDKDFRHRVFTHHLIHNSGTKQHLKSNNPITKIDYKGEWIENLYKQYTALHKKGLRQPYWYMVGLTGQSTYEMLTVLAINLEVVDWVFTCAAAYPKGPSRVCKEAYHLTQYSEIAPSSRFKRRLVTINMHELRKNYSDLTHVVLRAMPTSEPVVLHVDIYGAHERTLEVALPKWSLQKKIILSETPQKALVFTLILSELKNLLQVYQLFVEPISCSSDQHHASASLIVPWANESVHQHFTENSNRPFYIRIQNVKPKNTDDAKIRLLLEPSCTYRISIRLHIVGIFGQLARYYSPYLLTNVAVVFLLAFQNQIKVMAETETVPLFFNALVNGLKQSWVLGAAYLLSKVLSQQCFSKYLPQPEVMKFSNNGDNIVDFIIVPVILYMVSIVIILILTTAYCISLFTLESTVHKLTLKILAKSVTFTIRFSDYFMKFLQKVPFLVTAVLMTLCFTTCGGLALCVGMIFYFLKLTQMSQDYVEQVVWFVIKKFAKKCKNALSPKNNPENNQNYETQAIKATSSKSVNKISNNIHEKHDQVQEIENKTQVELSDTEQNEESSSIENIEESSTSKTKIEDKSNAENNLEMSKKLENVKINQLKSETKDEIEDNVTNDLKSTNNAIFFHSSMFFIWFIVMLLNIPAVLTWAHNFKYNKSLTPDESFFPGLILSVNALPLWHSDFPRTNRKCLYELHLIILYFIVVSLTYATISVYRLNHILTLLFALIVIQQCYAPKIRVGAQDDDDTNDDNEEKKQDSKHDEVKMKID